jgi:polo-like kinase 1
MFDQTFIEDRSSGIPIRYTKSKFLGKGGFASVFEVTSDANSSPLACKIIEKSFLSKRRTRQKLMNEIRIHRSLSHKNIAKFLKYFEDDQNLYILLELCPNESLSVLLRRRKRLVELEVQCYLVQVLLALKYLKNSRVIHRDIKLGNVLLGSKMEVKLADFGLAAKVEYDGERKRTICGTPNYIAPEILNSGNGHSYEVDVWSFGILMYTMLVGKTPFASDDLKVTYSKIKSGFFNFPDSVPLSTEAKDLISKILVLNPDHRPSIDTILDHPFLNKNKIPRCLPFSSLTIPLSESYCKAFDRKPLTPREFMTYLDAEEAKVPRSTSQTGQIRNMPEISHDDFEMITKELSGSLQTTAGSGSCLNTKEIVVYSSYNFASCGPQEWITMWIDYSHKYGIAYLMSNNSLGVLFNDNTKIIVNGKLSRFKYIEEGQSESKDEFELSSPPSNLVKKVQLVRCFCKSLGVKRNNTDKIVEVYVKRWILTQHAILFRLSNKIVQVYFRDQTEVFLCGATKIATYVNKSKEIIVLPIEDVMESGNRELMKRVKFCKDILIGNYSKVKK